MRKDETRIFILFLLAFCLGACGSGEAASVHIPTQVPTYTPRRHSTLSLAAAEGLPNGMPLAPDAAGPAVGDLNASRKDVYAVDLIAAWVEAGSPQSSLFDISSHRGNIYQANFDADVLPLFTQGNVWFQGAPSCASCRMFGVDRPLLLIAVVSS